MKRNIIIILTLVLTVSCGGRKVTTPSTASVTNIEIPEFNADSAFHYIKMQTDFGPRVPNTEAHLKCSAWLTAKLSKLGAKTYVQGFETVTFDNNKLQCYNIIGSYNPESTTRVILCSHWDSRPWADNDPDPKKHHTPVPAANDGASGVAVMMELCRQIQQNPVKIGVDFVCFDAEDMGTPDWAENSDDRADTWCLGSLEWAREARAMGYRARYGVLLDMVGGRGSTFSREAVSRQYADPVVDVIWRLARQLGYGHYFPMQDGGALIDDHVNVNRIARIPCIDIVPYFKYGPSSFGPTWHTVSDTSENIDPHVLEAVGQTLTQLLYNEETE
jgi:Zn-dependent M28 family amino/carboxypeptidase